MRENNWSLISRETSVCDIICPFAFQPQGVFSGVLLSARWDKQAKVPAQLWQAALTKNFPIFFLFLFFPLFLRNQSCARGSGSGTAGRAQRCQSCCGDHLTQGCVAWLSQLLPPASCPPFSSCAVSSPAHSSCLWCVMATVSDVLLVLFFLPFFFFLFPFTLQLNPVSWEIWAEPEKHSCACQNVIF